jgi:hypothetical protein
MMTPQAMVIIEQLNEANIVNHLRLDRQEIAAKAEILAGYLEDFDSGTIRRAFREHIKASRFLPTVNELIEGCRAASAYRANNPQRKALPDCVVSLEDRQKNIERLKGLKARLAQKRGIWCDTLSRRKAGRSTGPRRRRWTASPLPRRKRRGDMWSCGC